MGIDVTSDFNKLCDNLKMSNTLVDSVRTKYHGIVKCINEYYWDSSSEDKNCLYVGSYGRGTAIYASDIDIVVNIPDSEYQKYSKYLYGAQSKFIQSVKDVLSEKYYNTEIRGDGQVIVADFYDVRFEVVPAFQNSDRSYLYPDTNNGGSWNTMDPRKEIDEFNRVNNECNGNLKRLSMMVRAWNEFNTVGLPGYAIDISVYDFLKSYTYKSQSYFYYDFMMRDFLFDLSNKSHYNPRFMFGSNKLMTIDCLYEYKAKASYDIAKKATDASQSEDYITYITSWRKIFGSRFS